MKFINLFFLSVFFSISPCSAQDWITTGITDFATMDFPNTLTFNEKSGMQIFSATDTSGTYIVTITRYPRIKEADLNEEQRSQFYNGNVDGYLQSINGTVISSQNIEINGVTAREIAYWGMLPNTEGPQQGFKKLLYTNYHMISIDFWTSDDVATSLANKDRFFDSLIILADVVPQKTSENNSFAYNLGKFMGGLIGLFILILVFLGFVAAIFFTVRYFVRREAKTQSKKPQSNKIKAEKITSTQEKISCNQCQSENAHNAKYCSGCGYAL